MEETLSTTEGVLSGQQASIYSSLIIAARVLTLTNGHSLMLLTLFLPHGCHEPARTRSLPQTVTKSGWNRGLKGKEEDEEVLAISFFFSSLPFGFVFLTA